MGGIIRDIFTMDARPVFSLDSLRFGPIHGDTAQHQWNRSRFAGVAGGIAHYGNCIGVPTIGGGEQDFFRGKMNGCCAGRRLSRYGG